MVASRKSHGFRVRLKEIARGIMYAESEIIDFWWFFEKQEKIRII